MKKNIIIGSIFLLIVTFFYLAFLSYRMIFKFDNSGYVFTSNKIIEKLYINDLKEKDSKIDYKKITENEQVYKRADKYYIGSQKKEEIMINYPIISIDSTRVLNLNDKMTLINKNLITSKCFSNAILSNGKLYNAPLMDLVDKEDYFLLNITNNIFLNATKLNIKENIIPLNSIIYFLDNEIRYYYLDNGIFKYNRIEAIDKNDIIYFYDKEITYNNLLLNLNFVSKEEDNKTENEIIKDEEKIDESNDDKELSDEDEKQKYIKPEITSNINKINVYSMSLSIEINDNARRIETNPTFEIKYENKIYLRKVLYNSGTDEIIGLLPNTEFDITGYFTYRDEKDRLIKKTFLNDVIKTKDIDSLEPIKLSYSNDFLFSNKIEFNKIGINNNKNDEVLKGLKGSEVIIGDDTFTIPNSLVTKLKKENINWSTPTTLKSNTVYKHEFLFTDVAGNYLKVDNSSGYVKTIKQKPSANITITDTDLTLFKANIEIINNDNVNLENLFYVVYDNNFNVVKKDTLNNFNITVDDLDINTIYNLNIYATYDLEDGNKTQYDVLLSSVKVSTKPLSTLGFVRFNLTQKSITKNEGNFILSINNANTDKKLLEILYKINIEIVENETNEVVKKMSITDLNSLPFDLDITDLYSNTKYSIFFTTDVKQGSKIYNINATSNIKEFRTLKNPAKVDIINRFTNDNLIDFDVKISDIDLAIESSRVMLYVRNQSGTLISYKNLNINDDYIRLTFDKLDREEKYTFTYSVEEYNEGYNNSTYEPDKILLEETIETTVGIYGTITLESLLKEITSENLFDISNNKRWKKDGTSTINSKSIDIKNKTIKLSAKNGYATYSYFLPEALEKNINITFYARYTDDSNKMNAYFSNGGLSNRQVKLENLNTEFKKYSINTIINNNMYLGFYIDELVNNNTTTSIEIKDLNIAIYSLKNQISNNISDSYHSSGYIFTEPLMISGSKSMPKYSQTGTMIGNSGNGYARITDLSNNKITNFSYTGNSQIFTSSNSSNYKIELWGASGYGNGGKGAYTSGIIKLDGNTKLYVFVGQAGFNTATSGVTAFNGGGAGSQTCGRINWLGGGATDIRLINDKNIEALKSRIMVAAGGGSAGWSVQGGAGGELIGENGKYLDNSSSYGLGGTQNLGGNLGGVFGHGGEAAADMSCNCSEGGGGGGGYYGGGGARTTGYRYGAGGAGGSSYISGYKGCIAIHKQKENTDIPYSDYNEKTTYLATMYASIYDTKAELEEKEFYIQIIRDDILENNFKYDMKEPTVTQNLFLTYHLQKNTSYEIRLCVKIRDRYYKINSTFFTTDEEIRTIKNINDFFSVHTTGKYLVSEDLDFRNSNKNIGFWFSGKIDFQGHKLFIDVDGAPSSLISNVNNDGILSNMDVHFYLNNQAARSSYYGLFYDFRGKANNLKITVEESTNVANVNFCLIAYVNRGSIENFIINNKAGLSGQRWTSLGMMHNYGKLRNGYAYGLDINAYFPTTNAGESKRVGALAGYAGENSKIENVFSLIAINGVNQNNTENLEIDSRIGSIVGEHNRGIIKNIYSVTSGDNRLLTRDANIGNYSNVTHNNIYYVSDNIYNPLFSLKVAKLALKDPDFQSIINEDKKFNINDFVPFGYFPQIIWPDCMPNQEYISLPAIDDADLIDITNIKETKIENNSTIAILMVNNPNNETIVNVGIKDIRNVEILDQIINNNITTLTIRLSDPVKYISKYYVKSISARSSYGKEYTREYKDNERVLLVDMYREINNYQEWLNIKTYPTENFILNTDLDFENMPYTKFQITNVAGVLNGNGHTIKNLEITSGSGLINELRGTLKNLNVINVKRTRDNQHDRNGIVGYAYTSSLIDNVHVDNITLYSYNKMGGIVGYGDGVVIRNSSVNNVKNNDLSGTVDIKVGGLIGEGHNLTIQNSYVSNVNFDLTSSRIVYASGGFAGYIGSGNISNIYAVGNIISNSQETGGLVGRSGAYITNSISNIDITSYSDYIGGIVGNATNTNISNCLSLGSLYSYLKTTYIKRIAGNIGIANNNYAWDNQHINGRIVNTSDGEELLSKEELSNKLSYEERINFGSDFNYDDLELSKLPKLYNTNGIDLLPYQSDHYIKNYQFEINSIDIYKTISNVTALITINNPENYPIKDIIVDNMSAEIKKNVTMNGISTLEILLTPNHAFDSYKLSRVVYAKDGIEKTYNTDVKIETQFYKDLEKFEDWQKISDTYAENYRLTSDIDFSGKANVNHNIIINRLEGTGDTKKVLKNINFNVTGNDQALIKSINSHINNVEFNNVTMNSTSTSNVSRNGLILYAFGVFENTDFNNITLNLAKANYVGIISYDRTTDLRNINIDTVNVKGRDYTSGFISRSVDKAITNINISNTNIYGAGSYVASLIAHGDYYWTTSVFHLTGTNLTVTGTGNYVGGMFGYGGGNYVDVVNANVTGSGSYIGGVAGQYHSGEGRYVNISDSKVHGRGNNVGGLAGYSYNLAYCYVLNTKVYGDKDTTLYVGGMVGYGGHTIWYCGVKDSIVSSLGSYVGGIKGMLSYSTVHSSYVYNSEVTGKNYVGGIVGGHTSVSNTISRCMSNAVVTATSMGAGGILGYASNQNTDDASNKIYLYHNIVDSIIKANNIAGGLVGRMDKTPFKGHMYSNIISASISAVDPSIVIGSSDYYTMSIPNTKIYDKSTLNNNLIQSIGGITDNNYINYDSLKVQKNYTDIGFTTSYFNFSKLVNNYFPYLLNQVSDKIVYYNLPTNKNVNITKSFHLLPNFVIYQSSINSFNIEFTDIDKNTYLKVNDDITLIDRKVFTYNYDYKSDIDIIIYDSINEDTYKYKSDDIKNKIYVNKDNYYFIDDGKLITNNNNNNIKSKVLNLYDNKALLDDDSIISLDNFELIDKYKNQFYKKANINSLYEFNDYKIKTYYYYSTIDNEKIDGQLFVKNNNTEMIIGNYSINPQSIIIDNYNNKNYLTFLNKKGSISNLKDKIIFPKNFDNYNIAFMSNNILDNSNLIGIIYKNNNILVFNYRNGNIIYSNYKNSLNLVDYYINTFKREKEIDLSKELKKSQDLIKKLDKKSINEYINNEELNEKKEYITVYNDVKKSYDVYDLNNINNSLNDTINTNANLFNYYENNNFKISINSIIIFIIIFIIIILLSLILNIKNKKVI